MEIFSNFSFSGNELLIFSDQGLISKNFLHLFQGTWISL